MGKINTDSDALYGIRDAVIKLNSGIIESSQRFIVAFSEIDDQIASYLRRKENELDNKKIIMVQKKVVQILFAAQNAVEELC